MTASTLPDRLHAPAQPALTASRSSVAWSAALAVGMLLGYFVLAVALVAGLGFLAFEAVTRPGTAAIGGKLGLITGLVAVAVLRAAFVVERRGDEAQDGVLVSRQDEPELWALVDEVSAELGVQAPDDLRLVEDVNAFVHQDTRLLGLVGGRRHMGIGLPLLHVLTVDQLRGVIGHELGHYAGGDTRVSALVHRAGATVARTSQHLGPQSRLGGLFAAYARLYQRVSLRVRRRQELRADAGSVRVVGREAHVRALVEVRAAAAAWDFFVSRYVVPLWQAGAAPQDLYAGYRRLLAEPTRQSQVDEVRASATQEEPDDPYDSHPSLAARVEHVRQLPNREAPGDDRPARTLLRNAPAAERQVTDELNSRVLGALPQDRYALDAERLEPGPYTADLLTPVAALARATAAVDGVDGPAGLGRTLAVLEAGRDEALVVALTGDRRDLGQDARRDDLHRLVLGPVVLAAEWALVAAGRAHWQVDWASPLHLVDEHGEDLVLAPVVEQALDEHGVLGLRAALTAAEVPLDAQPLPEVDDVPDDEADTVLAVWPDLYRGWRLYDGFVTRDQLVLVRQRRRWGHSVRRGVAAQYPLFHARVRRDTAARVSAVLRAPLSEAGRSAETHTVRWDDLAAVHLRRGVLVGSVLRLPGLGKPWDRLKAERGGLAADVTGMAALLRRLVGDRLHTKVKA
jgi:Zn-dependent protease with chaperone function